MSGSRTGVLAVAMLLVVSLLMVLQLPVARARHVAVLRATDDSGSAMNNIRSAEAGVAKEPTSASGAVHSQASSGRRPTVSTAEMRTPSTSTAEHRRDEVAKLHDMLKRDYAWRARRRSPINNGEPLEEESP
ncbi:uncharacterized protein LOC102701077 [Oryza brachyantha]|uniref:Uncharacterized protein n=1 Tax=Oryza brachyantha TaxID=4533 RepID=J3LYQ3_ORYBR|nr:uncharacterized protein LOC102701077 [Oryza brachyantha]